MSVEAMKLARNFIKFNTGSSHYVIEQLDQAIAKAEKQPKHNNCSRSHPHENMDEMCELRTEIARLTNELAQLKEKNT
jgi:ubiquinone biosynthesis protein UbiJ